MTDVASFRFDHPRGAIYGWFTLDGLRALRLPTDETRFDRVPVLHSAVNDQRVWALHDALDAYFAGVRTGFEEIPLDLSGGTDFRQAVWQAAREIPWGERTTYGELARSIGRPQAARAVGQALGANPVPIVVPCHRIVGGDGDLRGFGCGLDWKRDLLAIESAPALHRVVAAP